MYVDVSVLFIKGFGYFSYMCKNVDVKSFRLFVIISRNLLTKVKSYN